MLVSHRNDLCGEGSASKVQSKPDPELSFRYREPLNAFQRVDKQLRAISVPAISLPPHIPEALSRKR